MEQQTKKKISDYDWVCAGDGFSLCRTCLADILNDWGIYDTGISRLNQRDVQSYFDDWYCYRVGDVWGLFKIREQERDYRPGFADGDYPGATVSFIAFDIHTMEVLTRDCGVDSREMTEFVQAFRRVTEYRGEQHDETLRAYFSDPASKGAYLIADAYIEKLIQYMKNGILPFPDGLQNPPERILRGIEELEAQAGRKILNFEKRIISFREPNAPTEEEKRCLLAVHSGNLSRNSFAAEVKYHADALVSWENWLPVVGKQVWYAAAVRADMTVDPDNPIRAMFAKTYYDANSHLMQEQKRLHGEQ